MYMHIHTWYNKKTSSGSLRVAATRFFRVRLCCACRLGVFGMAAPAKSGIATRQNAAAAPARQNPEVNFYK
jgi:hypothetical protein